MVAAFLEMFSNIASNLTRKNAHIKVRRNTGRIIKNLPSWFNKIAPVVRLSERNARPVRILTRLNSCTCPAEWGCIARRVHESRVFRPILLLHEAARRFAPFPGAQNSFVSSAPLLLPYFRPGQAFHNWRHIGLNRSFRSRTFLPHALFLVRETATSPTRENDELSSRSSSQQIRCRWSSVFVIRRK